jgi:PAS domain S-box-containing protein
MGTETMSNEKYKVLMIEDDKLDQIAFERLVETEKLQYDYTIADSVEQARNILACQQFDIIITDHLLGDGTAFDILDLVKNIPVVVVTGTGNEEIAVKAWRAGAYDYLAKDIERGYLKALPITIENAISHKRAEENLQLLSGAIMSSVDSVYITDMEDKITFVNKAFCDTYGYKKEEILGKNSSVLWLASFKTANTRSVFRTQGVGDTWEVGFYHIRKDGSIFPVSLARSIIKDANGNKIAVVGTVRDITERVLVEDELRRANLKLKERCQLKDELVIKVSETLRRLLSDENILDSRVQQNDAWKDLDTTRRIINDLLDISLIETGKMKLQSTELNLSEMVSEVVDALTTFAERKDTELKCIIPDAEIIVNGDRDKIKQALTDLIGNSIDLTLVKGHVEVFLKDSSNKIIVEIHNDGPGIESCKMNKVLNGFEWITGQSDWRPEQDRTLSLSIAKKIIELQGGWIWIEKSESGIGNNFCISLPKTCADKRLSMAVKDAEISSNIESNE